jgi:peptidylprolyl isomerase
VSERVQGRSRDGSAGTGSGRGPSRGGSGRASLRKESGGSSRAGAAGRSPKAIRAADAESTESEAKTGPAKAQSPRAARRAALREAAAARKAAEQRRRRFALAGLAVLVVVGLVVGYMVWRGGRKHSTTASQPPSSTAPAFIGPPVPAAANPALSAKPSAGPGTGDLTKLQVTTLVAGTGPEVKSGQTVQVNYVGVSYKTGVEFDSNFGKGQPFSFKVGGGEVIKGWDQGVVGVKVGSRVQLDIPADLAYGNDASGGKPAGPLRFIIDVLEAE